jgi:hypothetical protein
MLRVISLHILVSCFFASLSCGSHAAIQGKRVALVIGNSSYEYTSPLENPKSDAEDIAKALSSLGFEVMKKTDLNKAKMDLALAEFADALRGAKMGLFFYAGHGLQVSGRNYLVPTDAALKSASALDFEAVSLDVVQRLMENETQTNVLFLDACRDNPLMRNLARALGTRSSAIGKGLAPQESGAGTLISYSTQPGNVALDGTGGRNSPFAAALIKHLPTEGKALPSLLVRVRNDVMEATAKRQVPWEHSALTDELVLKADTPEDASPPEKVTPLAAAEETAPQAENAAPASRDVERFQVKLPKGQLVEVLDGKARFVAKEIYAGLSECVVNYGELKKEKVASKNFSIGDFIFLEIDDVKYRAMIVGVNAKHCTLDIMATS